MAADEGQIARPPQVIGKLRLRAQSSFKTGFAVSSNTRTGTSAGRALRAANWTSERDHISNLSNNISQELANNAAIAAISAQITASWMVLHRGHYYSAPSISFISGELEQLMRHLSIGFSPGETETTVDFSRLSDGQKSLLYFSLVLAMQAIGRKVLRQETAAFDIDKLRPAVFTLIALEEPENSLSPHYLGRILKCLREMSTNEDAQAVVVLAGLPE